MNRISLFEMKPFLRYSRLLNNEITVIDGELVGYDSRLFYCVKGKGSIEINSRAYPIKEDTLILWRSGMKYKYFPDKKEPMQFYAFNMDFTYNNSDILTPVPPNSVFEFRRENLLDDVIFEDATVLNGVIVIENAVALKKKIEKINRKYTEKGIFYELKCSGFLTDLITDIVLYSVDRSSLNESDDLVGRVTEYIQNNITKKLSNKEIGDIFGYHPNYLNSLFIGKTGKSLHAYLQNIRIMTAVRLLQETDLTITEIGKQTGFGDLAQFSKSFKKHTGFSPTYYRNPNFQL